ncbi:ATP-binding cassette subfamily B protein [Motilibacter peucedani]|uniref:ATP-binding cassette subfamily B protein n=1 Tax=Motilibacter peucedani TaxID=598650 RepID=A0A420XSY2_9ACTN|nr:ABC transporter ATP-binding protein [Motilibacter peucedani]RKS77940.1 ATP-binding cassette subfamily B protein [Motilibacter peucedani]
MLYRLLRTRSAPYSTLLAGVVVLQFVGTLASLYLPRLNADIIDEGIVRGDTGYIVRTGGWMLLVSAVQVVCSVTAVYLGARTAMGMGRDMRAEVFSRIGTFSSREVARFGAPSLITRTTNDVQQVQMVALMFCSMFIAAPIMCVGGIVMALREDVGLSWLVVVAVPVLAGAIGLVIREMVPQFRLMQKRIDVVNRVLREQITGIRVVRAFVREPLETERFGVANDELSRTALRVGRLQARIFPLVLLILNVSSVAVLWFGAPRVDSGAMQVGALTAFLSYLVQILMAVMMATFMLVMIPRAAVCAERITEVLDCETSVVPPSEPVRGGASRGGRLEFRDVEFSYPGAAEPVLRRISFVAEPGTTTAVVGSTGAGKTTLVSLVPRLFDATGGAVLVDGVDVRELELQDLWRRVAIVPQKPYLFTGTVASNVRYGNPDATDEEVWRCLEIAQGKDFVAAMPEGLASPVAQGGTNVSGGQRQRISIARALARRPQVYLFDDSFSALDLGTEARLRAALSEVTAGATVVVVAQRVSSILDADQILVLDDGLLVGRGTHAELLETCETYREIVESQMAVAA